MWAYEYNSRLLSVHRRGAAWAINTAVAAAVGIASAVSGGAVALHLAGSSPYAPPLTVRSAPIQSVVAPSGAATVGLASAPTADNSMPPARSSASPPIPESELTFAWGYAQRQAAAQAPERDPHAGAAAAGPPRERAERKVNRNTRPERERQRASVAHRDTSPLRQAGAFENADLGRQQSLH
jgi:hypothetical protein